MAAEKKLTGYDLSRAWFDFSFSNPHKVNPNHTALFFFAIEHCNRLGWKKNFGLPATMAMEALGIKSYHTYKKTFDKIVEWGFFVLVQKSINQYSSNVIALSKNAVANAEANDKALDKALLKHSTKQDQSTRQSKDSINKQRTINQEPPTLNIVADKSAPSKVLHNSCKKFWSLTCEKLGKELYWTGKHGRSLNLLLEKLRYSWANRNPDKPPPDDTQILESFQTLVDNLPQWYRDNQFDLSTINSKYDTIVSEIRAKYASSTQTGHQRAYDKIDRMFESRVGT